MHQNWQNFYTKESIIARNNLYKTIRDFFYAKGVLEVNTPLLVDSTVTDPYINSFEVFNPNDLKQKNKLYLQTSPEFAMKKLLCNDIGSIFQICKAFRAEEVGPKHNIEFTMLEWYRIGFQLEDLMEEMADLLTTVFGFADKSIGYSDSKYFVSFTYRELFLYYLDFDFNKVDSNFLINIINKLLPGQYDINLLQSFEHDDLLMILLSDYIEPKLDKNKITFLYDYPATQAALARVDKSGEYPVAKRFEVYYKGMELANGFYELADAKEQDARFDKDLLKRQKQSLPLVKKDTDLISALELGLPECSGVALGLDRLLLCM